MDCDWVFLRAKTKAEATLYEAAVPTPGDGKFHNGQGYVVRYVVTERTTSKNPLIIATETPTDA